MTWNIGYLTPDGKNNCLKLDMPPHRDDVISTLLEAIRVIEAKGVDEYFIYGIARGDVPWLTDEQMQKIMEARGWAPREEEG